MKIHMVTLTAAEHKPVALNDRRALLWEHGDYTPAIGDMLELIADGAAACRRIVTDMQDEKCGVIVSFRPLTKIEKDARK